jgi:hypothetical protein
MATLAAARDVSSPLGRWRASARREPLHPSLSASDSRQHDSGGSAGDGEERRHRPSRRERGKDQSRRVGLSAGLRPHDGAAGNYGVPLQVRDVSGLGARLGLLPAVRMDHSENNARPRVRSLSSLGCEGSKRIQTGEPPEIGVSIVYFTGDPSSTLELRVSRQASLDVVSRNAVQISWRKERPSPAASSNGRLADPTLLKNVVIPDILGTQWRN